MLENLPPAALDPLFALDTRFRADARDDKMDLVVGVYRDATGATPILQAVQDAERQMAEEGASKAYRTLSGNPAFNAATAAVLLGAHSPWLERQRTIQTVGGTGALRLLADFIHLAHPGATVWISDPGYVNHRPIMAAAGLQVASYHWHETGLVLDVDRMLADLQQAARGDVVLIQGCCHNPTGIDMPAAAWVRLAELLAARGLVPLVDMAYQGLGDGLEADAAGLRLLVEALDTVLVASSCSKNMGLYCERVGAATVVSRDAQALQPVSATLEQITRRNYSMPPDHGAAIAERLMRAPAPWLAELDAMRQRIVHNRIDLGRALTRVGAPADMLSVTRHKGMFSQLRLSAQAMQRLRTHHGIYGTESGRINIAGLTPGRTDALARGLAEVARFEMA